MSTIKPSKEWVLYKCRLFILQSDEKQCREELDTINVGKSEIKTLLKQLSTKLESELVEKRAEVEKLLTKEKSMRVELDTLSDLMTEASGEDTKRQRHELYVRAWDELALVLTDRNTANMAINKLENSLNLIVQVVDCRDTDVKIEQFQVLDYVWTAIQRIRSTRVQEHHLRRKLTTLLYDRSNLVSTHVKQTSVPSRSNDTRNSSMDPTSSVRLNKASTVDSRRRSNSVMVPDEPISSPMSIALKTVDRRSVLTRVCTELQACGMMIEKDIKKDVFVGSELVKWVAKLELAETSSEAAVLCNMLLEAGFIDIIRRKLISPSKSSSSSSSSRRVSTNKSSPRRVEDVLSSASPSLSGSPSSSSPVQDGKSEQQTKVNTNLQHELYRFRSSVMPNHKTSPSGWLVKIHSWRIHRRFYVYDASQLRLAYYNDEHVQGTVPNRIYWLAGRCRLDFFDKETARDGKYYFQLTLGIEQHGEKALLFAADSAQDRAKWLQKFYMSGCQFLRVAAFKPFLPNYQFKDQLLDINKKQKNSNSSALMDEWDQEHMEPQSDTEIALMQQFTLLHAADQLTLSSAFGSTKLEHLTSILRSHLSLPNTRSGLQAEKLRAAPLSPSMSYTDDVISMLRGHTTAPLTPDEEAALLAKHDDLEEEEEGANKQEDEEGDLSTPSKRRSSTVTIELPDSIETSDVQSVGELKDGGLSAEEWSEEEKNVRLALIEIVSDGDTALGKLCKVFLRLFEALYTRALLSSKEEKEVKKEEGGDTGGQDMSSDDVEKQTVQYPSHLRKVCKCASADIQSFLSHLMGIILKKSLIDDTAHPTLNSLESTTLRKLAYEVIPSFLFQKVYPTIMFPLFVAMDKAKDEELLLRMKQYRQVKASELGVSRDLCLDELPGPDGHIYDIGEPGTRYTGRYLPVMECLRGIHSPMTPGEKINAIVKSGSQISKCVDEFKASVPNAKGKAILITADDLLGIYTYMLLHANIPNLTALLTFMDYFIPETQRSMMSGYYLNTVQASVELLMTHELLEPSPLVTNSKIIN